MENNPQGFEDNSEATDKKDSKKKKKAERLGSLLVTPKTEKKTEVKEFKLFSEDKKNDEKSKDKKDENIESAETLEDKTSLEQLSEAEKQFVEREYVHAYNSEQKESPETPEEIAAEAAVEEFHDRIEDGIDSDVAYREILARLKASEDLPKEVEESKQDEDGRVVRGLNKVAELIMPSREDIPEQERIEKSSDQEHPLASHQAFIQGFNFMSHPEEPTRSYKQSEIPKTETIEDKTSPVSSAVVGGVIGYLIGRRRGRINSEKKVAPLQKKLQREVLNLSAQLNAKEESIRRAARRHAYMEQAGTASPMVEMMPSPNNNASEQLGQMIVEAEKVIYARSEKSQKKPVEVAPKVTKHVEKLSRFELLELSRKVRIDGTSLRQIYDSHLISERGLRRLMGEHLRGGNLKKALKRELVQKQIDFERDPVLRDQDIRHIETLPGANQLETFIEKATSALPYASDNSLYYESQSKPQKLEQDTKSKISREKMIDASLISTILILSAAVFILLMRNY